MKDHCFKHICCTAAAILAAFLQTLPVYALDAKAQDDDGFTVIMVGDILLHDGIEKCAKQEDGSYDFSFLLTTVSFFPRPGSAIISSN